MGPVGILSNQTSSIGVIGTSINQTISNTIKAKKSSIFKFQGSKKRVGGGAENIDFSVNPLLSVD